MLSKVLRTGPAVAFLVVVASLSSAQVPPPGVPATPPQPPTKAPAVAVQPAQPVTGAQPAAAAVTYRAKQILNSKIMLGTGTTAASVGTVDDIVFDQAGNLEYLIVANEGKLVTVPWDAAKFDLKSQTATLSITPEVYKTIPTYTATTYPDFWTPAYRTQTYKYYNLTPRELRVLNRIGRP